MPESSASEPQLKVHLSDGQTLTFILSGDGEGEWQRASSDQAFQAKVRGLSIIHKGTAHSIPTPSWLQRVQFIAEVIRDGERPVAVRAGYQADDILAFLTVYYNGHPPSVRMDVKRVGKPRWRPDRRA